MKERGESDYRPKGTPASFDDVRTELDSLADVLAHELRFRGVFPTESHAAEMRPAPVAGDLWVVLTTAKVYWQLSVHGRRVRMKWSGTIETM